LTFVDIPVGSFWQIEEKRKDRRDCQGRKEDKNENLALFFLSAALAIFAVFASSIWSPLRAAHPSTITGLVARPVHRKRNKPQWRFKFQFFFS
jgi:hypothetical protein